MIGRDVQKDRESYLDALHRAFGQHYAEGSDVWTNDLAMRGVPALAMGRVALPPSPSALDIGCGSGRDVEILASVFERVVGIDIVGHAGWVRIEEEHGSRVEFLMVDFLTYQAEERFDLVLDNGCFHHQHASDRQPYLRKAVASLAPGGVFVLSTFKNPDLDEFVDRKGRLHKYFTDEDLHRELSLVGFELIGESELPRAVRHDSYRLSFCRKSCSDSGRWAGLEDR